VRERVRRILINEVYKGVLAYGKRQTVHTDDGRRILKAAPKEKWTVARCAAIVNARLWERANVELHRNQLSQMTHAKHQYLLSGLLRCGICERNYIGCGPRYRCNGRQGTLALHGSREQRCVGVTVRRHELEYAPRPMVPPRFRKLRD
jgi:site-specific DNA recombinase